MGRVPVSPGLGVTCCHNGTIDGELMVAAKKNAFPRTANQRSWWRYWPRRIGGERGNNRNNESFQDVDRHVSIQSQCWCSDAKNIKIISAYSDNDSTQWRSRDAWTRLTPTTTATSHGRMGVGGPWKRRIVCVLKKMVWYVLKKTVWYVLKKTDWVHLKKDGLVVLKKTDLAACEELSYDSNRHGHHYW